MTEDQITLEFNNLSTTLAKRGVGNSFSVASIPLIDSIVEYNACVATVRPFVDKLNSGALKFYRIFLIVPELIPSLIFRTI